MTERPELHELESATGIHSRVRYLFAAQFASGRSVLDIACGNGAGTVVLADVAARVVGADTSAESIHTARAAFARPNVEYQHLTGSILSFPDRHFDVVVCLETLEHVAEADQPTFLAELRRVLKPNGVLVLSVPDRDTERRHALATGVRNPWHLHTPSPEELRALLHPFGVSTDFLQVDLIASVAWGPGALPDAATMTPPLPAIRAPIAGIRVCGGDAPRAHLPGIARADPRLESVLADMRRFVSPGLPEPFEGIGVVVTAIVPERGQSPIRVSLHPLRVRNVEPASTAGASREAGSASLRAHGDFQYYALVTNLMRAPSLGDLSGFAAEDARDVLAARLAFVQHELSSSLDDTRARVRELEGRIGTLLHTRPMLSARALLRWLRDALVVR